MPTTDPQHELHGLTSETIVEFKSVLREDIALTARICGLLALSEECGGTIFPTESDIESIREEGATYSYLEDYVYGRGHALPDVATRAAEIGMHLQDALSQPGSDWPEAPGAPSPLALKNLRNRVITFEQLSAEALAKQRLEEVQHG